ncbi:hypothetical protein C2G38_2177030 [Gigaspora rosea]|uniref:Uncharacterized protein n=1 Tax=Gigaspora rosea TaxID=44941 RepID=A0A397VQ09_9GLOM|nr:hypothetical protein C2G38_2177030 [Gigaspora rosea]
MSKSTRITNNYKLLFLTTTSDLNKEILEQIEKKVLSTNPDADPKNYPDDLTDKDYEDKHFPKENLRAGVEKLNIR